MEIYLLVNFILGFFLMHISSFLNDLIRGFSKILGPVIVEESLKAFPPIYLFYKYRNQITGFLSLMIPVALGLGFGLAEALNYFILLIGYKTYDQLVLGRLLIIFIHLIGSLLLGISLFFNRKSRFPLWIFGFFSSFLLHYYYNVSV